LVVVGGTLQEADMRRITKLSAVTIVAVLALSAIAAAAPLSKKEWLKQGNAVCKSVNDGVEAAAGSAFAGLGKKDKPTDAQFAAFAAAAIPVFKDGVAKIDALEEPTSLTAGVTKFTTAVSDVVAKVEADPTILSGDPFKKVDKIARKIGLKTCAEG
jgi:hypothetical protein